MNDLQKCQQQSQALEKKIQESKTRWQTFSTTQTGYKSIFKFEGITLPPPVMTVEKRRKMQMYRKQAYIAEIRLKSRSREKDFMMKIQGALDEVRDFHIDTSESSDTEVIARRPLEDISVSSSSRSRDIQDSTPPPSAHDIQYSTPPPSAHDIQDSTPPPSAAPSSSHISKDKEVADGNILLSLEYKAKSTTDLSKIDSASTGKQEHMKLVARIHRRRYNSEGKSSESDESSKPPKSCMSPSHSKKSQSSSNLLTIPFEQYQQQVEEMELSRARQRYREGRAKAMRSPSPQPLKQNHIKVSPPIRPASSPAVINKMVHNLNQSEHKTTPVNGKKCTTVSTHALKLLLNNLDPSHDQPTHHWLSSHVGDQEDDQGDISLDAWFQNAPDSVKQKLVSLLPKVTPTENTDDCKVVNKSVHISPVHTCNSCDDTLRSTSPLPDEDLSLHTHSFTDMITSDDLPLVVIEKSPNTSPRNTTSGNGTDSYNARDPCATSIDTVIEVDVQSSKAGKQEPVVPPLHLSSLEPPMSSTLVEDESPARCMLSGMPASERKRSLSMQSYTLEEPSEALLNSTLNEKRGCADESMTDRVKSADTSSAASRLPLDNSCTDQHSVEHSIRKSDGNSKQQPKLNDSKTNSSRIKTKIPTRKPAATLLSKCQLDTPPFPVNSSRIQVSSRTPLGAAKHRQLIKLADLPKSIERRSLTPTPPSRVLTPTPPSRPQSEMGTRSSRIRLERKTGVSLKGDEAKVKHQPKPSLGRRLQYDSSDETAAEGNSRKHVPALATARQNGDRLLPPMHSAASKEKQHEESATGDAMESPLKTYKNREERISRARKQLALLKSKVSARTLIVGLDTDSRPKSSSSIDTGTEHTRPMSSLEINGGVDSRRTKSSLEINPDQKDFTQRSPSEMLNGQHENKSNVRGKENINDDAAKVKSPKGSNKEERPISTAYSENANRELGNGLSSLGTRLSGSSRSNRRLFNDSDITGKSDALCSAAEKAVFASPLDKNLHALIKGHLCRKLLGCSKVKSIVKTIQDCQSLLPSIVSVNRNSAAYDVNFQQRIKLQMGAAKEDLHEIFFNMEACQRLFLIKQSDRVLACHRGRQTRRKHEKESKWHAKDVAKKCQQQVHSSKIVSSKSANIMAMF